MTDQDEELLATLLLEWEEQYESGQEIAPPALCKNCPHLIEHLTRRIDALKITSWMDKPIGNDNESSNLVDEPSVPHNRMLGRRYRLDDLIATGGFAEVWRGYDTELLRPVAIKVPRKNRMESADSFMAEARRVARLKHPGIVPVHDVGRDGDSCFIVSELVEGGNLADHLSHNPPTQQQSVRWVAEIADALEYAHLHGVVHRDIKPANILIDHHNRALLADFGIAQSASKGCQESVSLGTLGYMSPEQLAGKLVDNRADIFSLGVVLYESLTGTLPYSSAEPNVLRREILAGADVCSDSLPNTLRQICQKALALNPHQRHTSAAELSGELKRYLETPSPTSKTGVLWVVCVLIILASGAFLYWQKLQSTLAKPPLKRRENQKKSADHKTEYWLNTASGVRHNDRCEHFRKTKEGRVCGPNEGKLCRVCGS